MKEVTIVLMRRERRDTLMPDLNRAAVGGLSEFLRTWPMQASEPGVTSLQLFYQVVTRGKMIVALDAAADPSRSKTADLLQAYCGLHQLSVEVVDDSAKTITMNDVRTSNVVLAEYPEHGDLVACVKNRYGHQCLYTAESD